MWPHRFYGVLDVPCRAEPTTEGKRNEPIIHASGKDILVKLITAITAITHKQLHKFGELIYPLLRCSKVYILH